MTEDFDVKKTENLLAALDNEIEQKCLELKEIKKNTLLKRIFFLGCALSLILPVLDVFLGFSIITTLIPILVFQAISLVFLIPVILNSNGGTNHVERVG